MRRRGYLAGVALALSAGCSERIDNVQDRVDEEVSDTADFGDVQTHDGVQITVDETLELDQLTIRFTDDSQTVETDELETLLLVHATVEITGPNPRPVPIFNPSAYPDTPTPDDEDYVEIGGQSNDFYVTHHGEPMSTPTPYHGMIPHERYEASGKQYDAINFSITGSRDERNPGYTTSGWFPNKLPAEYDPEETVVNVKTQGELLKWSVEAPEEA